MLGLNSVFELNICLKKLHAHWCLVTQEFFYFCVYFRCLDILGFIFDRLNELWVVWISLQNVGFYVLNTLRCRCINHRRLAIDRLCLRGFVSRLLLNEWILALPWVDSSAFVNFLVFLLNFAPASLGRGRLVSKVTLWLLLPLRCEDLLGFLETFFAFLI